MTGHSASFRAIERDSNGIATKWIGECQCGEDFTGPDYYDVEALWDAHRRPVSMGGAA
jgi:hypothetical protein